MRTISNPISALLVTAVNALLLAGCAASPALERPDDASGTAQRSAPNAAPSPYAQPPSGEESESANVPSAAEAPTQERSVSPTRNATGSSNDAAERNLGASDNGSPSFSPSGSQPSPSSARAPAADSRAESRSRGGVAYKSTPTQPLRTQPEVRPGLGTTWGETRTSTVRPVSFTRQTSTDPFALFRVFYNDQTGILAQTGERSLNAFSSNYTEDPNRFVSVEIVDPNGTALPGVYQNNNTYVLGRDGERYAIRVRNHDRQRFEIVATVDGLDVIDGSKGNFSKRGYILDPYGTLLIEGYRRSGNAVATFRFGSVADSYAARTSGDRNVGVIGIAVFAERTYEPVYTDQELERRETADPFPSQYARPPQPRRMYEAR
jgi:hypothetical protein